MTIEDYLTRARKFARAGKPRPMEVHLDIAQEYARRIGKNIPAEEVEEIRKTGYENGINRELAEAERYARDGKPPRLIEMYLIDAKKYAEQIGKDISAEVEEIYEKAIRVKLKKAERYAIDGDAPAMELCLSDAQECAERIGKDISDEVEKFYEKAIRVKLAKAKRYARDGDVPLMKECLSDAQEYAKRIGKEKEISAKVEEIQEIGYENGIPVKLREAKELAEAGKAPAMELCLFFAEEYAEQIGKDISVEEIRKTGYENGINRELAEAERYARDGDAPAMEVYLSFAQEYAEQIGKDISAKVEEIRGIGYKRAC